MMVLGVCGFGYSGSGAVWDMLKEWSNCKTIGGEKEFTFLYAPDGLEDLRYHLVQQPSRFMSSDIAIKRFISFVEEFGHDGWNDVFNNLFINYCMTFLDKVIQVKWDGYWEWDIREAKRRPISYCTYRLKRKYNSCAKRKQKGEIPLVKMRKMYLSINPIKFDDNAKQLLKMLLDIIDNDSHNKIIAINQVFPANNAEHFLNYFDESKAILVIRDPRDVYITLKLIQDSGSKWFPHDDVNQFIKYYRILHDSLYKTERILIVKFEDLIYQYELTKKKICAFCGGVPDTRKTLKYFSPEVSKRNTMLYLEHEEFKSDIEKINSELSDYLYPFDESINISHKGAF